MSNYKTVFFTLGYITNYSWNLSMVMPILAQVVYSEIDSSFIAACYNFNNIWYIIFFIQSES